MGEAEAEEECNTGQENIPIVTVDDDDDNPRPVPGVVALDGVDPLHRHLRGRQPAKRQKVNYCVI